jgi:outer membrane receptor protein involved in Fe transport
MRAVEREVFPLASETLPLPIAQRRALFAVGWGEAMRFVRALAGAGGLMCVSTAALAAGGGPPPTIELPTLDIFSTTPLSGTGVDVKKVPAAVTKIDSKQIEREKSPDIVKSVTQFTPSAGTENVSGNDFQPDVFFRGFDASPINGTPQGLAVYQNGVRINESFGDTVNWDLIPTVAVRSIDVISNNPAFGLNALGGALEMTMKDGFHFQGTTLNLMGGSFGRAQGSLQWGKQVGPWAAYIAIDGAHDGGYRHDAASDLRRVYGDIGYKAEKAEFHIQAGGASNTFGASGPAPFELLQQGWGNVYTLPQASGDQVGYVNLTGNVNVTPTWSLQGVAHVRSFYQSTQDGNATDAQPCDPAQGGAAGFLCFNDGFSPANGLNGAQLPNTFPPGATLGEIDRTHTQTTSAGLTLQATNTDKLIGHNNHFVVGASFDYGVTHYGASAELGVIQPDFVVAGSGIFLGPSGNPVSDGPVSLRTTNAYSGLYALDAFDVTDKLTVSAGGRFNYANIVLQDQLGTALNGGGDFWRFNPMIGATYKITHAVTAYAGYSEANRAPTPQELGCADPVRPCILASFLVSDPSLQQVVARTFETGLRGSHDLGQNGHVNWKLGVYRTDTSNDIMNVPDPVQQGFGYFQNVGATRRQGVEAEIDYHNDRFSAQASYAYIDATFLNAFMLGSNSPYAVGGNIQVLPGDQMPMIPHHRFKLSADYDVTPAFKIGGDVNVVSSQYFEGDASNQYSKLPGYWVADLTASYQLTKNIQLYALAENVFDNRYYTYGTFFDTTQVPNFANGGAPFTDPRLLTPARPQAFYVGVKATF